MGWHMDQTEALERRLQRLFDREHPILMGRGTTAIYSILATLEDRSRKIVLPATLCPSPAIVSVFAGFDILFCDVRLNDFTLDPGHLESIMQTHDDVSVVMAVHLYGHPADMDVIVNIAHRYGALVIEDAAQSVGASYQGRPCGSLADVSVVSFGRTKILDAGWGGAALTNDDVLAAKLRHAVEHLPRQPLNILERFQEYRSGYYALHILRESKGADDRVGFRRFLQSFHDIYIFGFDEAWVAPINHALDQIDNIVDRRRLNAATLAKSLEHSSITRPIVDDGAVPWRYSILLQGKLQRPVTEALRKQGFDASNWYPSLYRWYGNEKLQNGVGLTGANHVERQVLNLWVDPTKDESYERRLGDVICSIIDDIEPRLGVEQ